MSGSVIEPRPAVRPPAPAPRVAPGSRPRTPPRAARSAAIRHLDKHLSSELSRGPPQRNFELPSLDQVPPPGPVTYIGDALLNVLRGAQSGAVAAVVLVSDGADNSADYDAAKIAEIVNGSAAGILAAQSSAPAPCTALSK